MFRVNAAGKVVSRIPFQLFVLMVILVTNVDGAIINLSATDSADFGAHVTWATTGNTTSMSGLIDDSPTHGDFRFESSLIASALGAPSNGGGSAFFLTTTLDPTVIGRIATIDYFIEQDIANNSTSKIALMIRQNGNFYRTNSVRDTADDGVFTDFSLLGLTEDSFSKWDNPTASNTTDRPDFSATGGLIEIGLASDFGTSGLTQTRDQEIQNFSLTVTTVPEPSSLALMGLIGVCWLALKRFKSAEAGVGWVKPRNTGC